ncbi:MAG: hypothetical protein WCK49_08025 [Myxococcaceae bacterium]
MREFFFLGLFASFMVWSCVAVADRMKPPRIIMINGQIPIYEQAAKMLMREVKRDEENATTELKDENLTITGDTKDGLLQNIVHLYKNGEESNFKYIHCSRGKPRSILGIHLDKDQIITQVMPCER